MSKYFKRTIYLGGIYFLAIIIGFILFIIYIINSLLMLTKIIEHMALTYMDMFNFNLDIPM